MDGQRYQTRLRYQVLQELQQAYGVDKVRHIARRISRSASGVWYQLQNLLQEKLVVKAGNGYALAKHLTKKPILASVYQWINGDSNSNNHHQVSSIKEVLGELPAWFEPP